MVSVRVRLLVDAGKSLGTGFQGAEVYLPRHQALALQLPSLRLGSCEGGEERLPAGAVSLLPDAVLVALPGNLTCATIEVEARRQFLHRSSHDHDASRGMDLPPAVALVHTEGESVLVFSDWGLETPPLPDFSMPFNVIAVCSSAMAFLVGSFLNLIFKAGLGNSKTPAS